jgi:SAM-dependent methyltransferase
MAHSALSKYRKRSARLALRLAAAFDPSIGSSSLTDRTCPICGFEGPFKTAGRLTRSRDALCPSCLSKARHRLLRLFFERSDVLDAHPRALHFAPEPSIARVVQPRCSSYATADLFRAGVDLKLDLEALDLEDASYDLVICSHVLEHVDDTKALKELFRVLAPAGAAVLAVPIVEGMDETYEAPEIVEPRDRLVHFGQEDHLRLYGKDFRKRVQNVGFSLTEFTLPVKDCIIYSVPYGSRIFVAYKQCRRRSAIED